MIAARRLAQQGMIFVIVIIVIVVVDMGCCFLQTQFVHTSHGSHHRYPSSSTD